jgi:5-methylcytosine-specific restriction endonuclease McrA
VTDPSLIAAARPSTCRDITGQRYGLLIAVRWLYQTPNRHRESVWLCICDCGKEHRSVIGHLTTGDTKSCGCERERIRSETHKRRIAGQKFGRLTAIRETSERRRGCVMWECQCDCGAERLVKASDLIAGITLSCGCAKRDRSLRRCPALRTKRLEMQNSRRARQLNAPGTFTEEQVSDLYVKQKGKCANCLCRIKKGEFHRDHIVALSRKGSNFISNIQLLCPTCNTRKNSKDHIEFAQMAMGRLL